MVFSYTFLGSKKLVQRFKNGTAEPIGSGFADESMLSEGHVTFWYELNKKERFVMGQNSQRFPWFQKSVFWNDVRFL